MAQDLSASSALAEIPLDSDEEHEDLLAADTSPPPLDQSANKALQAWLDGEAAEDPRTAYRESELTDSSEDSGAGADFDNDTDTDDESACADGDSAAATARAAHDMSIAAALQGDVPNDAVGLYRLDLEPEDHSHIPTLATADDDVDALATSVADNLRRLKIGVPDLRRCPLTISANFYEGDDDEIDDVAFVLCATADISTDHTARFFKLTPSCLDPLRVRKTITEGDDADTDDYAAAQTDAVDYSTVYDDYSDDDDDSGAAAASDAPLPDPPAPPQPRTWIPERGRVAVMLMMDAQAPVLVGLMTERYDCTGGAAAVEERGHVTGNFLDQFNSGTGKRAQWLDPDALGELCEVPTKVPTKFARADSTTPAAGSACADVAEDGDVSIDDAAADAATDGVIAGNSGTVPPPDHADGMSGFSNPEAEHEWSNRNWREDIVCAFSRDIATGKLLEVRFALSLNSLHLRRALQTALANSPNTI